jgi:hypothetical protein
VPQGQPTKIKRACSVSPQKRLGTIELIANHPHQSRVKQSEIWPNGAGARGDVRSAELPSLSLISTGNFVHFFSHFKLDSAPSDD